MGAYAEIQKVHALIERTRSRNTKVDASTAAIHHELRQKEARILRRQAAEAAEQERLESSRPLMFTRPDATIRCAQSA